MRRFSPAIWSEDAWEAFRHETLITLSWSFKTNRSFSGEQKSHVSLHQTHFCKNVYKTEINSKEVQQFNIKIVDQHIVSIYRINCHINCSFLYLLYCYVCALPVILDTSTLDPCTGRSCSYCTRAPVLVVLYCPVVFSRLHVHFV